VVGSQQCGSGQVLERARRAGGGCLEALGDCPPGGEGETRGMATCETGGGAWRAPSWWWPVWWQYWASIYGKYTMSFSEGTQHKAITSTRRASTVSPVANINRLIKQ